MTIKIIPTSNPPAGKLADAELHFADLPMPTGEAIARLRDAELDGAVEAIDALYAAANALAGLKLIGFAIWERRDGKGRNVTWPARHYSINGERRSFALLRPATRDAAHDRLRDLILKAYAEYETAAEGVE